MLIKRPQDGEATPRKKILLVDFYFLSKNCILFSIKNRNFPCQEHFYLQILYKIISE